MILVRGPMTFMGYVSNWVCCLALANSTSYLNDEIPPNEIWDADGFLKTGDIAHLHGEDLVFDGRQSGDCT